MDTIFVHAFAFLPVFQEDGAIESIKAIKNCAKNLKENTLFFRKIYVL